MGIERMGDEFQQLAHFGLEGIDRHRDTSYLLVWKWNEY
jgi:hypothetical protein